MTIDRNRLRSLATAATPGPWWISDMDGQICSGPDDDAVEVGPTDFNAADNEYVCAVSPDVVLALLDQLAAMTVARDRLYEIAGEWISLRPPGIDTIADVAVSDIESLREVGR